MHERPQSLDRIEMRAVRRRKSGSSLPQTRLTASQVGTQLSPVKVAPTGLALPGPSRSVLAELRGIELTISQAHF
jgi:hypothetical protein